MRIKSITFFRHLKIQFISLLFILTGGGALYAQYHPVHATVQWPSPQSPYLSDYYSGSRDRLMVTLLNRDLQQPLLFAKLRIKIKSAGFQASSREDVTYPVLELNANIPTRLTNIDLAPYLQPHHLHTNGSLRNGQLPVGYTEFSLQVIDYYTGRALSAWHTGRAYLDVKKPPLLNFPEKDAQVGFREPLYIRFHWTPRHQGISGTEYEFVLKELPDNGADPRSAFAYGNEIYRVRTRSTTLNYTHLEPILIPNRRYAWQVQAIARDGVDQVGMFENGGFSEINWFHLSDNCLAPTELKATPGFAKVELSWGKVMGATGYVVACRPKTKLNLYEWSSTPVAGESLTLAQLKPGWAYEWRVGTLCTDDRPVFSDVREFTLSKQNEELLADCGKEPVSPNLSQEPNLRVKAGDVVTIGGDYPMTIIEATSLGDGWYSGRGKTRLKTLVDAPVSLRFARLRINVDNYQIDGTVEASYDETKAKIANLDYVDDGGKDIKPATIRMREHKMVFTLPDIPQFTYNPESGTLETTDADGIPRTIPMNTPANAPYERVFPMLVTDSHGNSYQIDVAEHPGADDDIGREGADKGVPLTCERVERMGDFNTESLSSKYGYVLFEQGEGKYAFDDAKQAWYKKSVKLDRFYKPFSKGYIAPWKLIPTGEHDVVTARYDGRKDIDLRKVRFVSEPRAVALPAKLNEAEMTWSISLRSVAPGMSYDVFAVYEGVVIGKLRVVSYATQHHRVTLVPINDVQWDKSAIEQELNAIYAPVGVQFTVGVDESLRGNYDWEVESEKDGLLSTVGKSFWGYDTELKESTEMLRLQQVYHNSSGRLEGVYLFVLDGAKGLEGRKESLLGEMPRKSRFGYLFADNHSRMSDIVRTIAHELGHGLFTLRHTFDGAYAGKKHEGKTDNLMDYAEGKNFAAFQWNVMASPAVFTAMDKAKDGDIRLKTGEYLGFTPDGRVIQKRPEGYAGIFDNSGSCFIFKFQNKDGSYYTWIKKNYVNDVGDVFEVPDVPVSGKVAIWTHSKHPACYAWYKFITVQAYTSAKFDSVKEQIRRDDGKGWMADRVAGASDDCFSKHKEELKEGIVLKSLEADSLSPYLKYVAAAQQHGVEISVGDKVYRLEKNGEVQELRDALGIEQLNSGLWDDDQDYKLRFTTEPETGIIQLQAFGIKSTLSIPEDKLIDRLAVAEEIRKKTNEFLRSNEVKDLSELYHSQTETFADGGKLLVSGSFGTIISEGVDVTTHLLKTGEIKQQVYRSDADASIKAPGLVTGGMEVVAQKVTDLTSLGILTYDLATDPAARSELVKQFREIKNLVGDNPKEFFPLLGNVVLVVTTGNTVQEWENAVKSPDVGERSHLSTRGVGNAVATVFTGAAVVKKLPEIANGLAQGMRKAKRISDILEDFMAKSQPEKLRYVTNIWKTRYPLPDMFEGRTLFEHIMRRYRYTEADGWKHTADIAENFRGIDFYKGTEIDGVIRADVAVSMKTTTMTDVDAWFNSPAIRKNVASLLEGCNETGIRSNKKAVLIKKKARIDIYMPKENVNPDLRQAWSARLAELSKTRCENKIEFEIKTIEEFIK